MNVKFVGQSALAAFVVVAAMVGGAPSSVPTASAYMQQSGWVRIENRWEPGTFINVENGLTNGAAERGWHSADWSIERSGAGYVRIRNRWLENEYLHIENGRLEVGPIESGWHSAEWTVVQAGDGYVRFRNSWKTNHYIHIENGTLEAGPIQTGWHSAMWKLRSGG